jgi:hypothetical protein
MKGAITPKEFRSAGNLLLFNVNEGSYRPENVRILTRTQALDGTVIFNNWGIPEGNRIISLDNTYLSVEDYEALVAMKEDDDYEFHYHYKNTSYQVIIERAEGVKEGDRYTTSITLSVVEKLSEGETS